MSNAITQKGDFQPAAWAIDALLGNDGPLRSRDWALLGYMGVLALSLGGVLAAAVARASAEGLVGPSWPLLILAVLAVVAERQNVSIGPRAALSVSFLPIVLAAVIYGPVGAMLVSTSSLLLDFGRPHARWIVWTSTRSLAAAGAGFAASAIDGPSVQHSFVSLAAAVAVATVVEQFGDLFLGSITAAVRGVSLKDLRGAAWTLSLTAPLYAPLTAVLVYAYRNVSPWSIVLFLIPAFAAQKLFILYQQQRAATEQLSDAMERQERAHISFASALVATLDAKDQYTAGHSSAVAMYARDIAARLGLSEDDQRLAHLSGLVHDIGKIGLPAGLLEKPGSLAPAERREMQKHAEIGESILRRVEGYEDIALIVRHHHERVDGTGYPDGLTRNEIPRIAKIIAVADAYNAMTSDRPYREAMPSQVARLRMAQAVGTQFDVDVVAAFEALLASSSDPYRIGMDNSFDAVVPALRDRCSNVIALAG
jgi:putative nucleotidyltransferase with HDIG domain